MNEQQQQLKQMKAQQQQEIIKAQKEKDMINKETQINNLTHNKQKMEATKHQC